MIFKIFCDHNWSKLVSINKPKVNIANYDGFKCSESLFEQMLYGSIKVIFSCKKCGKIIEREYIGLSLIHI